MAIKLVVAHDRYRGIGREGQMPWKLPEEMRWLAETTRRTKSPDTTNVLVMGRMTYESIPFTRRPLPGRRTIVLSSHRRLEPDVHIEPTLEKALLSAAASENVEDVYIFGGGQVYEQALKASVPEELLVSVIDEAHECDTFFPAIPSNYTLSRSIPQTYDGIAVRHDLYLRH